MTVAEFMQHALLHPQYGYYSQPMRDSKSESKIDDDGDDDDDDDEDWFKDDVDGNDNDNKKRTNPIFGPRGDFVTAPEICQVFGESIQVWMVTQWEAMGKPKAFQFVEFGPGRGTLMADMVQFALAAAATTVTTTTTTTSSTSSEHLQDYGKALRAIHLIEPSRPLRQKQQATLQERLSGLVEWKFHNPASQKHKEDGFYDSVEKDSQSRNHSTVAAATTTTTKPTIHVYWHDSFASVSAMIMRRKQGNLGHSAVDSAGEAAPTTAMKNSEDHDIADLPMFVVCQEFFDALPVHAFEMTEEGWRERMVDMAIRDELLEDEDEASANATAEGDAETKHKTTLSNESTALRDKKRPRLRIVLAPEVTPALKTLLHVDEEGRTLGDIQADIGQVVEVCPEGILLIQDVASLLEKIGGAALVVDYGEEGSADSLRGFWKHQQVNFLSLPGQTDVTADVDFTALKHSVNHTRLNRIEQRMTSHSTSYNGSKLDETKEVIKAYGPVSQGKFLVSMGARERVINCIELDSTSDEEAEDLFHALERLVAPEEMGTRYKVLALAAVRTKKEINGSYKVAPAGFSS